ncbi:unnamed protein product, partial [Polarella glacialis]
MRRSLQRFSNEGDTLSHATFGAHCSGRSKVSLTAEKRSLARQLATSSDLLPCNLRRDYLDAHPEDEPALPSMKDLSRHRYLSKKVVRDLAPSQSPEEMKALIETMAKSAEQAPSKLEVP